MGIRKFVWLGFLALTAGWGQLIGGLQVDGTRLLDANGEPFIFRGVNIPHAWYRDRTQQSIRDAAGLGVNSVRLVLSAGHQWKKTEADEIRNLLNWCREARVISVFEVHDCTGYGESEPAVPIEKAVEYWLEMQPLFEGTEGQVVINIANEPFGNGHPKETWINAHRKAIRQLRDAGYRNAILVDAANWGQDWRLTTLQHADQVFAADPLKNTFFAVHMYEVFSSEDRVQRYLNSFEDTGFCLIVGEFAANHFGKPVAAEAILKWSDLMRIGYLGWSWCGNSPGLTDLDIVKNWDPQQLSEWGELLFLSEHGIQATAKPASKHQDAPLVE